MKPQCRLPLEVVTVLEGEIAVRDLVRAWLSVDDRELSYKRRFTHDGNVYELSSSFRMVGAR